MTESHKIVGLGEHYTADLLALAMPRGTEPIGHMHCGRALVHRLHRVVILSFLHLMRLWVTSMASEWEVICVH